MSSDLTPQQAYLVLNALPNIGPISLNRLLDELDGDPCAVFQVGARRLEQVRGVGPAISGTIERWREHFDLAREEAWMEKARTTFVAREEEGYPPLLREIPDPPIGLYRKGNYLFTEPCIAIVGSR